MNLIFKSATVNKKDFYAGLLKLVDEDFGGENGEGYTSDIALGRGFKSDLEYHINLAQKDKLSPYFIIRKVLFKCYDENGYYTDFYYDIHALDEDRYRVSIACLDKN